MSTTSSGFEITDEELTRFTEDGFVIVERIIDPGEARSLAERYDDLFAGRFETGLYPDEWNWRPDRDAPDHAAQPEHR